MKRIKNPVKAVLALALMLVVSCDETQVPRPRGYFRIDLPERKYSLFEDSAGTMKLPFSFEYPSYAKINRTGENSQNPGWFNIEFPEYHAKIYLTYKEINNDFGELMEQTYKMNVKNHISKADAINEKEFVNTDKKVFGILYDLKGNTATAVQFYATDSLKHYLRGSLYFNAESNADSLKPVIEYFRHDVVHIIETLEWR